jgi:hypothetical protein
MVGLLCLTDVDIGEKRSLCLEVHEDVRMYVFMCAPCMKKRWDPIHTSSTALLWAQHSTLLLLLHLHSAPQGLLFGASTTLQEG